MLYMIIKHFNAGLGHFEVVAVRTSVEAARHIADQL